LRVDISYSCWKGPQTRPQKRELRDWKVCKEAGGGRILVTAICTDHQASGDLGT